METTTKATRSDSFCVVKNDIDEIDVAYCGPVAEIVAQKLVDLFSSSSSSRTSSSSRRRISPLKLGEIIQEEEDKDEDKEDNENAMRTRTPTTTTTTTTNPSIVVIVVETVENDEIAKEGLEVVKILLNASKKKKRNETTKTKSKRRRKYVLVGVGDSRFLAERQSSARTKIQRKIVTPPREF